MTTMPTLRLPIHSTFILSSGKALFDIGTALFHLRRASINFLLHAADVLDTPGDSALSSFRFLNQSWTAKRPLYEHMLSTLSAAYRLVPTRELLEVHRA